MLGQNVIKILFSERSYNVINVLVTLRENVLRTTFLERLYHVICIWWTFSLRW